MWRFLRSPVRHLFRGPADCTTASQTNRRARFECSWEPPVYFEMQNEKQFGIASEAHTAKRDGMDKSSRAGRRNRPSYRPTRRESAPALREEHPRYTRYPGQTGERERVARIEKLAGPLSLGAHLGALAPAQLTLSDGLIRSSASARPAPVARYRRKCGRAREETLPI